MSPPERWPSFASRWFLALLVPALAGKLLLAWTMSGGDLSLFGAPDTDGSTIRLLATALWPADVVVTTVLVAALTFVYWSRPSVASAVGSGLLAICLVALGLGAVSLHETGALPSAETLRIVSRWIADHPATLWSAVSWRRVMLVLATALWGLAPWWLRRSPVARSPLLSRLLLVAIIGTVLPSTLLWAGSLTRTGPLPQVRRSFWTLAASAFNSNSNNERPDADASLAADHDANRDFPRGKPAAGPWIVTPAAEQRRPRHVVVISLETAPARLYDLERSDLPAFSKLAAHAVIASQHYSTAPLTSMAIYSLLAGVYPPSSARDGMRELAVRPDAATHALPAVLAAEGYDTTYLDSYDLSWNGPEEASLLREMGFQTILDASSQTVPPDLDAFGARLARERRRFAEAAARIQAADAHGAHAFVVVATHLGHYDWPAPPNNTPVAGRPLEHVILALDELMDGLVTTLTTSHLIDDTIIVVTGDHGLRFRDEFDAAGEPFTFGDLTFHVPFIMASPALFPTATHIKWPTSHIDLAPTLLMLLGLTPNGPDVRAPENAPTDAGTHLPYQGEVLLDPALESRLVLLPSGRYPGLRPANGVAWKDGLYAWYDVVDRVTFRRNGSGDETTDLVAAGASLTADEVRAVLSQQRLTP